MISNFLNSQFVLIDALSSSDTNAINFGQNIQWLSNDLAAITSNITTPWISNDIIFSDKCIFDGGFTTFGSIYPTFSQQIDIFQILKTNRAWINSVQDILNPTVIKTIGTN